MAFDLKCLSYSLERPAFIQESLVEQSISSEVALIFFYPYYSRNSREKSSGQGLTYNGILNENILCNYRMRKKKNHEKFTPNVIRCRNLPPTFISVTSTRHLNNIMSDPRRKYNDRVKYEKNVFITIKSNR